MIRKVYILLLRLVQFPRLFYKHQMFKKNAFLQKGKKNGLTLGPHAYCENKTGKRENIQIGQRCDILGRIVASGTDTQIRIGDYPTLRGESVVRAVEKITIGSHVIISNHVSICDNNNHPTDPEARIRMTESGFYSELWNNTYSEHKPVVIEDNVWIGEYATVLKGVTIGEGAVVGCHAVVTKDVAPYTIVAGNPARCVKNLRSPE